MIFRAQVDKWMEEIRASYWFIPAVMALGAILLALAATSVDRWLGVDWGEMEFIVAATRPDGARAILTVIGGSMIGVAGTVFSVTMAAVVYASGQYGPRLLTNFLSDRGNQVTLGTFTATFVFSVLVLTTIRSPDEGSDAAGFVPQLAVTLAIALALCSIAVLIYFIHHVPSRIHISNVIREIGEALISAIDDRFPRRIGDPPADGATAADADWQIPPDFRPGADRDDADPGYREVNARERGYVQFLDEKTLMEVAERRTIVIRLNVRPGKFLFDGALVYDVWPKERVTDEVASELLRAIATGARRTPAGDMLFLVDELVEIAARALSPGVNDPFTAIGCIDWLAAALAELATRPTPSRLRTDTGGKLRVIAETLDFAAYLRLSLGAIREYAAGDKITALHMLQTIEVIARQCDHPDNIEALRREADDLVRLSQDRLVGPSLAEVEKEAETVLAALRHPSRRRPFPKQSNVPEEVYKAAADRS